jgi:6-phosphogluconate dehydrogenase
MAPQPGSDFGLVGLGVMGSNLALNVADHGFRVALWDRRPEHGHEFVRASNSTSSCRPLSPPCVRRAGS